MSVSVDAETGKGWECLGPISSGGTVFGLAISPLKEAPYYWAATGCGVFRSQDGGVTWEQSLKGLSTPLLSAIAVSNGGALLVGALGGDLARSVDFGSTWTLGLIPTELKATVTALAISPRFHQDGVAFAATDGGGLLATHNSGNVWEDSSFGLGEGTVLAVAVAPDWSRTETVFASVEQGVYVSRNGGRAWRETGFMSDEAIVSALAVSPMFESDHHVYAGTEDGRLYRSVDAGRTWDVIQERLGDGPVNCLWLAPDYAQSGRMVAGAGAGIYVSTDAGATWRLTHRGAGAVLALTGDANVLLAGFQEDGAWRSTDGGETWTCISQGIAARGFAGLSIRGSDMYAMGPQEGLWVSADGARSWRPLLATNAYLPLSAYALSSPDSLLLASQEQGILLSRDGGQTWSVVCERPRVQALRLSADTGFGCAGTADGHLLLTRDGGQHWEDAGLPADGQEIIALAISPSFALDHTVFMGTAIPSVGGTPARVALWRSKDGASSWSQLTTQVTDARWMDIALPIGVTQDVASQAVLATGAYCLRPLRRARDVWISTRVDAQGSNALGVLVLGEIDNGARLYIPTGNGVFRSIDSGRTWQPYNDGLPAVSVVTIAASIDGQPEALYALSLGGLIWRRPLS